MPFTFSHPLYAVPLHRAAPKWLSVTGLLLGSMAPDFEYFIALESYRTIGHSLIGFILMGIPLSIGMAVAFHFAVKPVLPKFIPSIGGLDQYVASLSDSKWKLHSIRDWIILLYSLFIGFFTHIFMDDWTHQYGYFVEHIPMLKERIAGRGLYQWLQLGFSGIGILIPAGILLHHYLKWRAIHNIEKLKPVTFFYTKITLWLFAIIMGSTLFILKCLFSYNRLWTGIYIVAPLTSLLFGIFAASILYMSIHTRRYLAGIVSLVMYGLAMFLYKLLELKYMDQYKQQLKLWIIYMAVWSILLIVTSRTVSRSKRT